MCLHLDQRIDFLPQRLHTPLMFVPTLMSSNMQTAPPQPERKDNHWLCPRTNQGTLCRHRSLCCLLDFCFTPVAFATSPHTFLIFSEVRVTKYLGRGVRQAVEVSPVSPTNVRLACCCHTLLWGTKHSKTTCVTE